MRARRDARVPPLRRTGPRRQARRPGRPVRARISSRLPSAARAAAACLGIGLISLLGYLMAGPLLVVDAVEWHGNRFTSDQTLERHLSVLEGASLLVIDTRAISGALAAMPGVADARVDATLPDRVSVTIFEEQPGLVWQTRRARFVATADGALVAELPVEAELPAELAALPVIDDGRSAAAGLTVGSFLPPDEVRTAERLSRLNPAVLGSVVSGVSVRIDDLYGFTILAPDEAWTAALGFYGREPGDDPATAGERLERQIAAVRTVFTSRPEATVVWLDARNPGKVYFRASEG
ncbi:MAG: cell division protein FtsQ/DivIB [Candidatus Limnocylindria bacterium]